MYSTTLFIGLILSTSLAYSAPKGAPKVGRTAAARYFQNQSQGGASGGYSQGGMKAGNSASVATPTVRSEERTNKGSERLQRSTSSVYSTPGTHYMTLGGGSFIESKAYKWGKFHEKSKDVGKMSLDVSYRLSQDDYLFDQLLRLNYSKYSFSKNISKVGFLYAVSFPEASTRFPLYFGFAVGPGVFLSQLEDESVLSLDYQMYTGLRLFNLAGQVGLYIEGGIKNHFLLLSDGQFNGTYIAAGAVFDF